MSARAFLRDLRHYSSYVIDQAALGVFQACAIAAEKVIDAYAPLEAREMQRAANRLAWVEEQIDVWESESEWLGNKDFSAVSADDAEFSPAGESEPPTPPPAGHLNPSPASAPASHHRVAGGNSPGAACDTPLSPAPGHPTTFTAKELKEFTEALELFGIDPKSVPSRLREYSDWLEANHEAFRPVAADHRPGLAEWLAPAVCDVLAEHRPVERGSNRDGTFHIRCMGCPRSGDFRDWREHVAPLISERIAAVLPHYPGMGAAKDAAFTTVVNQHAEALRHLD